jgi:hypothetical protein
MRNIIFKNVPNIIGEYSIERDETGTVVVRGATQPFKFVQFKLDPKRSKLDWKIQKFQNGELHLECVKEK